MADVTGNLEAEIRRLRIRIIELTPQRLSEPGQQTSTEEPTSRSSRRETIAAALTEFSSIGSEGRTVPDLGDQSLADQVVVLLQEGMASAADLPDDLRQQRIESLLESAVRLRRSLA